MIDRIMKYKLTDETIQTVNNSKLKPKGVELCYT